MTHTELTSLFHLYFSNAGIMNTGAAKGLLELYGESQPKQARLLRKNFFSILVT